VAGVRISRRSRTGRIVAGGALVVVLLAALALATSTLATTRVPGEASAAVTPDEAELTRLITDYWNGVENNDNALVAAQLCPEDREMYEQESDPDAVPVDPREEVTVDIAEIRIVEPYAAIRQTPSIATREDTAYAQRIDGRWLLCLDAEALMQEAEGTAPASPTD